MRQVAPSVPIILVSALDSEGDVVRGLELGAVAYVTKPFSFPGAARSGTCRSSEGGPAAGTRIRPSPASFGCCHCRTSADGLARRKTWVRNQVISLSPREFDLLGLLLSPPDHVRTRDELMDRLWSARELNETHGRWIHTYIDSD